GAVQATRRRPGSRGPALGRCGAARVSRPTLVDALPPADVRVAGQQAEDDLKRSSSDALLVDDAVEARSRNRTRRKLLEGHAVVGALAENERVGVPGSGGLLRVDERHQVRAGGRVMRRDRDHGPTERRAGAVAHEVDVSGRVEPNAEADGLASVRARVARVVAVVARSGRLDRRADLVLL